MDFKGKSVLNTLSNFWRVKSNLYSPLKLKLLLAFTWRTLSFRLYVLFFRNSYRIFFSVGTFLRWYLYLWWVHYKYAYSKVTIIMTEMFCQKNAMAHVNTFSNFNFLRFKALTATLRSAFNYKAIHYKWENIQYFFVNVLRDALVSECSGKWIAKMTLK